jgi:predicted unusual protein kinase regulating ubiquinone biosynthesis (AarF/ABC1/UbiB family)
LNKNEQLGEEHEEEQNQSLKACHQRCADRTLKVLEKNGSIFIKLGQHLVSSDSFFDKKETLIVRRVQWATSYPSSGPLRLFHFKINALFRRSSQ